MPDTHTYGRRPGFDTVCPDCMAYSPTPVAVHGSPDDTTIAGAVCTLGVLLSMVSKSRDLDADPLPDDFDTLLAEVRDLLQVKAQEAEGVQYY